MYGFRFNSNGLLYPIIDGTMMNMDDLRRFNDRFQQIKEDEHLLDIIERSNNSMVKLLDDYSDDITKFRYVMFINVDSKNNIALDSDIYCERRSGVDIPDDVILIDHCDEEFDTYYKDRRVMYIYDRYLVTDDDNKITSNMINFIRASSKEIIRFIQWWIDESLKEGHFIKANEVDDRINVTISSESHS